MQRTIKSAAAVALLTVVGIGSQAWALGNINTSFDNSRDNRQYHDTRVGGSLSSNSNNHSTVNRNDNRDYSDRSYKSDSRNQSDNRNMSDNRDQSNRSVTSTDMSNRSVTDNSNRSVNTSSDSHNDNRVDNTRNQSHDYKVGNHSIFVNGAYTARAGHDKVEVGGVQGTGHMIDNSINGASFGLGHTSVTTK